MKQELDSYPKLRDKDVEFLDVSGAILWNKWQSFDIVPGKLLVITEPRHTAPRYKIQIDQIAKTVTQFTAEQAKDELERLGREREPGHNGWLYHEFEILGALRFSNFHTAAHIVVTEDKTEREGQISVLANVKNSRNVRYYRMEELTRERERDSESVLWGQILLLVNAGQQRLSWQSLPFPQHDQKPQGSEDLTPEQAIEALYNIGQPYDPAAGELLGAVIVRGGGLEIIVRDKDSQKGLGIDVYCANG